MFGASSRAWKAPSCGTGVGSMIDAGAEVVITLVGFTGSWIVMAGLRLGLSCSDVGCRSTDGLGVT